MFKRGFIGVDIFFVISGFLIVTLLLREREKTGKISLENFYMRRFLRIFPIYYTLLAILTLFLLFVKPDANMRKPFFEDLPYYATYTSNWHQNQTMMSITWSLATEEQFYLLWPFLQKYVVFAMPLLIGFFIFNQGVNFGMLRHILSLENAAYFDSLEIVQCTFTPICLGIFLAYLLNNRKGYNFFYSIFGKKYSPFWACLGLFIALNLPGEDIRGAVRLTIQIFAALLIASLVVKENNIFQRILTFYPIKRIGVVSYGMYLYHLFLLAVALKIMQLLHFHHTLLLFFLTLILTYLFSEISYRFYESPLLRLKKRYEPKIPRK
jgi:peptidoglycan/LPS O-acetylase OafA/YrhL